MRMPFRKLCADDSGAAVIELAIVAPVLALMTMGVIDMSNGFSRKLQLEQGTQRAIEKVMQTTGVLSVEDTIANEVVCQVNGTNANGSCKTAPITTANVSVEHRLECNGVISTTDNDADGDYDCPDDDDIKSQWIKVTVWSDFEPMFPLKFSGVDSGGKYRIQAVSGMRTQ
ncbi:TadE/TadG family type IV pilus assembly protein [Sphingomonas mesophila]|uniref:TadE/TadG family type IV pilus assembly protein n=1 Tax=Sphingomonas mesophila TaxID=2303576 RepID=UPI000E58E087|nr:TadE/TadG family type IV pilus assembly protein [Sphingomonas mesophila]